MATTLEPQAETSRPSTRRPASHRSSRSGGGLLIIGIVGVALVIGVIWTVVHVLAGDKDENAGASLYTVKRDNMLITVTDDGNVESASNVDIKCELMGGGTILSIVQDGTLVEAGQELFRLDTATIENDLTLQNSTFEKATATKIQSEQSLSAAESAVKQYKEGTFVQELQLADQAITVAQQNLTSAKNNLEFTEKMVRKGFATPLQKESDEFAVKRAELELAAAETAKRVLKDFTYDSQVRSLEAARDSAAAQLRADQATLKNEEDKLKKLQKQLAACVVNAPAKGMVVYANENRNRFGPSTPTIEEGAQVRQGQTIIKLPDLSKMQVIMTVHESKIDQIRPSMPARIVIQGKEYKGAVVSIKNQPEPQSFMAANVKEYATAVAIQGASEGLRPGMTAQVDILLAEVKDAIVVPVSCVVQQGAKFYCWVQEESDFKRRELTIGRTNDKDIEVNDGVKEGDVVLRNPRAMKAEAREEVPAPEGADDVSKFGEPMAPPAGGGFGNGGPRGAGSGRGPDGAGAGPGGGGQSGPGGGGGRNFNPMSRDADGDGKLSRDEVSDRMKENFDNLDTNSDGFLDAAELAAMRARFSGGGGPRGGGPDGGRGPGGQP